MINGVKAVEFAWCRKCGADVSIAHAVAEFPCPTCGAVEYIVIADDGQRDALLSLAERMMRLGRWEDAASAFDRCLAGDLISAADYNLSLSNLEWRKLCAASGAKLIADSSGRVPLEYFRGCLELEYDVFVVQWLLNEYQGFRLIPSGRSFYVEGS